MTNALTAQPNEFTPRPSRSVAATPTCCCCCCCCLASLAGTGAALGVLVEAAGTEQGVTGAKKVMAIIIGATAPVLAILALIAFINLSDNGFVGLFGALLALAGFVALAFSLVNGWQSRYRTEVMLLPALFAVMFFTELFIGLILIFLLPLYLGYVALVVWLCVFIARTIVRNKRAIPQ